MTKKVVTSYKRELDLELWTENKTTTAPLLKHQYNQKLMGNLVVVQVPAIEMRADRTNLVDRCDVAILVIQAGPLVDRKVTSEKNAIGGVLLYLKT